MTHLYNSLKGSHRNAFSVSVLFAKFAKVYSHVAVQETTQLGMWQIRSIYNSNLLPVQTATKLEFLADIFSSWLKLISTI
jgi:hypothetical protein